jgi:hypothetical protein
MKYDEARLKVKGYDVNSESDSSSTSMITAFERKLPFVKIDIEEFERRVKKLSDPS